ncbi:ankyrin repeat domain-containing protein 16-like isoform X2 [Rhynchophorus ferrugineus]|uniref:ankyrin repeat domain-containing protein 16-like isoform X2 n=1 Tax=Rhynchophorus ferrugineus TaxID=354439 RepID=UPI003FCE5654
MDSISKEHKRSILKEIQNGEISLLKNTKIKYPDFHWNEIYYEKTGDSILHVASHHGYKQIIQYLLREFNPCAVDIKNRDDKTPLHEAAQFARYDSILELCSFDANVNVIRRGDWTPLMLACTKIKSDINYKIVVKLVEKGAHINAQNKDGWTCAHILAREGCIEIYDHLISNGLNVNIKTKNGRTALHIACLHGHKDLIAILLKYIDINTTDNCGNTPLHEAILGKNIEIATMLIQNGAEIKAKNNSDFNLLHLAASQDNTTMLDYLINGLQININIQNKNGWTPLHCAARKGLKNIYYYLEKNGANTNIKDNYNRTALDYISI